MSVCTVCTQYSRDTTQLEMEMWWEWERERTKSEIAEVLS